MKLDEIRAENQKKWEETIRFWNEKWNAFIEEELEENALFHLLKTSEEIVDLLSNMRIQGGTWNPGDGHLDDEQFYFNVSYQNKEYAIEGYFYEGDTMSIDEDEKSDFYSIYAITERKTVHKKEKIYLCDKKIISESEAGLNGVFIRFNLKECIVALNDLAENLNERVLSYWDDLYEGDEKNCM